MRWWIAGCVAAMVAHGSAGARPVLKIAPDITAGQVLDACGADDPDARAESCDRLFEGLVRVAHDSLSSPLQKPGVVCLVDGGPLVSFRARVIAWIRAHPDDQPLEFLGEGSQRAVLGAYARR